MRKGVFYIIQKILIVIDMQNDFVTGSLGSEAAQVAAKNIAAHINEYDTVIFTRDTHGPDYLDTLEGKFLPVPHCIKDTEGWEIIPELVNGVSKVKNLYVVDKDTFGTFIWGSMSVNAALLVKALGKNRVIGVKMPQGNQHDIDVANKVIDYLGIDSYEVNIDEVCKSLYNAIDVGYNFEGSVESIPQIASNSPARIRMTVLYAIAAREHGRVANTCNKSEDFIGYSTKFGDAAGDFSVLSEYTVSEVRQIGKALGIPNEFIFKAPEDGLSGKTDEDNLGFTYDELDNFLLQGHYPSYDVYKNIEERHKRNLHKVKPMPSCPRYYSTRDWEV